MAQVVEILPMEEEYIYVYGTVNIMDADDLAIKEPGHQYRVATRQGKVREK